jgi:hypothetical protein
MDMQQPSISEIIGIVRPSELSVLTIVGTSFGDNPPPKSVSRSPEWWTPRAKSKASVLEQTSYRKSDIFE